MKLNRPTTVMFLISLAIAIIAALTALGTLSLIPLAAVWIMGIGYAVLAIGCLMRGV